MLNDLKFKVIRGGIFSPKYQLISEYRYDFAHNGRQAYVFIPEGFKTDGATGRWFAGFNKLINVIPATFFHDYIFENAGKFVCFYKDNVGEKFSLKKNEVDAEFIRSVKKKLKPKIYKIFLVRLGFVTVGNLFWYTKKWGLR